MFLCSFFYADKMLVSPNLVIFLTRLVLHTHLPPSLIFCLHLLICSQLTCLMVLMMLTTVVMPTSAAECYLTSLKFVACTRDLSCRKLFNKVKKSCKISGQKCGTPDCQAAVTALKAHSNGQGLVECSCTYAKASKKGNLKKCFC